MPWVRFDDQFSIHRKVAGLSDAAFRLHVAAIFWCARNLTDGVVPEEDLVDVCARVRKPARFAAECVKRDAWHDARHECGSEKCAAPVDADGWVIHDYLVYQPSKAQVMADREKAAERQRKWREKKSAGNGSSNAVSNGVTNATPPRPAPKEAGRGEPRPDAWPAAQASPAVHVTKPPWCGKCDQRTRHTGEPPRRCPDCHPLVIAEVT